MYDYELIRSSRRTLSLEIRPGGAVVVRAPLRLSKAQIDRFVAERDPWIRDHIQRQAARPSQEISGAELDELAQKAKELLPGMVERYASAMGLRPAGITITAARTRYGSCSPKNRLCFSCLLMRSPTPAIELVVVHELCHITEKNHGKGFYALLSSVLPDWRERKKLLK